MSNNGSTFSKLDSYSVMDLNFRYTFDELNLFDELSINLLINNIFNTEIITEDQYFKLNDIKLLGTFLFDNKIHEFDLDYDSEISNSISDKIVSIT